MCTNDLRLLLQEPLPDLACATALLAQRIAYPDLDLGLLLNVVEQLAAEAAPIVAASPPKEQGAALMAFLFGSGRFRGNQDDYANPRNSFINEILDSGLGIPISLSALFLMLSARLGIEAHGVGLPGHFVVGIASADGQRYFDPFYGGRELSIAACSRLVTQTTGYEGPLQEAWLAPVEVAEIVARMLRNLRTVYLQAGQWSAVQCVLEQLCLVEPRVPSHMRDLGLVMFQRRQTERGIYYLEAYLRAAPEAEDRADLQQAMAEHLARVARLN
jgi:regulator of sirC expression with transglutaminase-like and TPR domain